MRRSSSALPPSRAGPVRSGWWALFVVLELFTNLVLETVLYAGAAGVSQVALLVSLAFWTWLWGPLGLLMATPLTVCLVVLGKHVSGLEFVANADGRRARARPEFGYYQRLLARDQSEAADLIERTSRPRPPSRSTTPCCCRRSTMRSATVSSSGCRSEEETAVIDATRELLSDAAESIRRLQPEPSSALMIRHFPDRGNHCACWVWRPTASLTSLRYRCSAHLLDDLPIVVEITKGRMLASELVSLVQAQGVSIICLANLPPSPPSKTRYLVKRLHAALPEVRILVGRWGPPALADDSAHLLRDAGAALVASTLAETRAYLGGLVEIPRIPLPGASSEAA